MNNKIVDNTCKNINKLSSKVESKMPYKSQYVLEEVIKKLKERVWLYENIWFWNRKNLFIQR